mmetsp:Transcript_20058/g.52094  ORF Transcript_20058/g.52094 Transcript_20058/m.52094 type:complete len:641 (+) Transcript_20058:265-2187(+)
MWRALGVAVTLCGFLQGAAGSSVMNNFALRLPAVTRGGDMLTSFVEAAATVAARHAVVPVTGAADTELCAPPVVLPLRVTVSSTCNITAFICTQDGGHTWVANATAASNGTVDKEVPFGTPGTNQTLAFYDSLFRLLASMDATFDKVDCACYATDVPEATSCTIRVAFCAYVAPINASGTLSLLFRARAWDTSNSEYTAASAGYASLIDGSPEQEAAEVEAANNLRKNYPNRQCGTVTPLVIFPGFSSSTVEYKMNDSPPPPGHPFCPRDSPNGTWAPLLALPPGGALQEACWQSTFGLDFDPATKAFEPIRTGLQTRVLDFGGFGGIPGFQPIYAMFQIGGWEVGKTIFGVPFDWRLPSVSLEDTYTQMVQLIENASAINGGKKVTIWAFSGGPQPTLGFLHRQSQAWKDKYISWFVATSPVWGGTPEAVAAYVSGTIDAAPGPVNATTKLAYVQIRALARALPSALWYFPRGGTNATTSWTRDEPVVTTKSKQYSAFDAAVMLTDLGAPADVIDALQYLSTEPDLASFDHPGTNTFVTYGTGFPSLVGLEYDVDFEKSNTLILPRKAITETGDNLVPLRSSLRSLEWSLPLKAAGKQFIQRGYAGQPHANCFPLGLVDGDDQDVGLRCFRDVLQIIMS